MTDIFDTKITCKNCDVEMKPKILEKEGLQLRAVECPKCHDRIVHPADLNCLNHFNDIKDKKFNVKLRMVGNSHAISIPKEIVDLISEQQRIMGEQSKRIRNDMDEMVRLAFEDFGKLSLTFLDDDMFGDSDVENNKVKRKVKDYGDGNMDIVETENLNDSRNGINGVRFRKISKRRMP